MKHILFIKNVNLTLKYENKTRDDFVTHCCTPTYVYKLASGRKVRLSLNLQNDYNYISQNYKMPRNSGRF